MVQTEITFLSMLFILVHPSLRTCNTFKYVNFVRIMQIILYCHFDLVQPVGDADHHQVERDGQVVEAEVTF